MDRDGVVLIFDLDGTLFRTETVTVPATRAAFERHGLAPPPEDEICALIGRPAVEYNAWLERRCPPETAAAIIRDAAERELELIGPAGRLYPGVAEALASLRRAAGAMAVCSNGSRRYVETVLAAHGLAGHFDAARCRLPDDTGKPQMAAELLEKLDFGSPARRGAVIGDRGDDIDAARANGLRAVGCAWGYGRDGELDGADAVAAAAAELPALVAGLLALRA